VTESEPLRQRLEQRLKVLEAEFETGRKALADLEARQASLRDTMLRLAGAVTVLKEELDVAGGDGRPEPAGEVADEQRAG